MIFVSAKLNAHAHVNASAATTQVGLRETCASLIVIASLGVALLAIDPRTRWRQALQPALQTALVSAPSVPSTETVMQDGIAHNTSPMDDLAATPSADEEPLRAQLIAFALSKVASQAVVATDPPVVAPAAKPAAPKPRIVSRASTGKGAPRFKTVEWPNELTAPQKPPGFLARSPLSGIARYAPSLPVMAHIPNVSNVPKGAAALARSANKSVSEGAGFLQHEIRRGASSLAQLAGLQPKPAK